MKVIYTLITASIFSVMTGCGGSSDDPSPTPTPVATSVPTPVATPVPTPVATPTPVSTPIPIDGYTILSYTTLDADGPGQGSSAYDLITDVFASGSIEAPDLYAGNHQDVEHIYEDTDIDVGNHFVFIAHRDLDGNKETPAGGTNDRQRNEIKVYGSSLDELKGYENDYFEYRWKFKINSEMTFSTKFSHFFQLKAVGGDEQQPIITISAAKNSGVDKIEVRHSPQSVPSETNDLELNDLSLIRGEWVEVLCRAKFSDSGFIELSITRLRDNLKVIDVYEDNIDMWRGDGSFVRPKWGIYRSIIETDSIRADEEDVRFANFEILEIEPLTP